MPTYPSVISQLQIIDPIGTYGCTFDHRVTFDGACNVTTSTTTINSATITFTNTDLNKRIVLSGAGASGAQYVGSITAIQSTTAVTVSPVLSTTVSAKGLQVHTDDLAAWTNLIADLNNSTYPGGIIMIRSAGITGFTNRSGISSFLPSINKQVQFFGIGGGHNADAGDYTKIGGSCIAYVGTSNAPTAFGAVMTIAAIAGATNQSLKQVSLNHMWIDCRNGDQNEALKGLSLQSCFGWELNDFYVQDPCSVGIEFLIISPGTSGALGEAKDCSRGVARNVGVRCLDSPSGITLTATTTTTAALLTTTGQSFTLASANALTTTGYVWMMTNVGYPVLVNYTGGGGTTTLTGCTVSLQDSQNQPTTVSGSNVVQAVPGNACAFLLDGDATANANLNHFDTCVVSHGTTWGPAAIEFRNADSNEMTNVVINGGNAATINAINRITKPGVRLNGSAMAFSTGMNSRNNVFKSGSTGIGGICQMGVGATGTNLTTQSGPNYWGDYQLGNGEAIPVVEGNSYFQWSPNGGVGLPTSVSPVLIAAQSLTAATQTLLTGSLMAIPPQGFQIGMSLRWIIHMTKTAAGTAIPGTFLILVNTTGTSAGAGTIATMALTSAGTAVIDTGTVTIDFTVRTLGTAATGAAHLVMTHGLQTTGWMAVQMQEIDATMTTWNSSTNQQYIMLAMTSGTAVVPTITQCRLEVLKPSNP